MLMDFDSLCRIPERNVDKVPIGYIIFYTKTTTGYLICNDVEIDDDIKSEILVFLNALNVSTKSGTTYLYTFKRSDLFYFCALGCLGSDVSDSVSIEDIRKTTIRSLNLLKDNNVTNIIIGSDFMPKEIAIALTLGSYKYDILKTSSDKNNICFRIPKANDEFLKGKSIAYYQNFARFLADTPANLMTPSLFVDYAKKVTENLSNVTLEVFDRKFMEEMGMNLLLSVSNGSIEDPKLLYLRYKGKNSEDADISFVGKGVTFDSGGISLKPSSKMAEMKADMLGAATVLSTLCLASEFKLKLNVTVTIPLTENLPSGTATKPGDVKVGMSGKSVEIDNTDAEGRLILADAITYTLRRETNVKYLVDVATLTGAMRVALGNVYSGLFCNSDEFATLITSAGEETDDLVWRMPLSTKYRSACDSYVADIKNIGAPGSGGSCTAAIFLKEFVDKEIMWAHIDIASTMCDSYNKELYGKGMSGKPVMMLHRLCEKISENDK
ncbi:hypothetical protein EDEG_01827 [Edhazardia aedis USNM 41457]|uniref:leucyl aminopeptidase n=1 Tax=Edhazardia aedis (strain USNM 41457) TaxID=1003232 RepID=J9D8M9_EDHAE|nr:hypothetical protein EDEG_01827 [Edhazardia aedis USNM 41457]|eukprot:EJW03874.1 hypothetical protein EDEG_01827 [Edhazardia aedis USNM 41457]